MRRCQFCGTELSEQARFCGNCGNPVSTLPDMQSDVGGPPAVDVQSRDAPTFISDASWPTVVSEKSEEDAPTFISDASLPTVVSERPLRQVDTPWWGLPDDQDVQNRQPPYGRQNEKSQSLAIDPFFPGASSALNSPPAGQVPMVQGTPQVGGIPSVQGTPSMLNSPPAAPSSPPIAQGIGHSATPSAPSPSVSPSASPPPEPSWRVQTPQTHPPSPATGRPAVVRLPKAPRAKPKTRSPKFDNAIQKIGSYLQVLSKAKNAKMLLLLGAILLILGSGGVLALDEKLEPNASSVGFLGFDEGIERQLAEAISHGHAHAIATAYAVAATGTAAALQHPYPQNGKLVYNDTLSNNSKTYPWVYGYKKVAGTDCFFANGAYHVVESNTNHFYYCIANNTNFSNFAFQVEMTFIRGNYGGILFRSVGKRHYVFWIGRDGSYSLRLYVDDRGSSSRLLAHGRSTAIQTSLNQANLIAVVARGDNIDLYVNHQYLTSVHDSSYSQGQIGLEAEDHGVPSEVMFSNVEVRAL